MEVIKNRWTGEVMFGGLSLKIVVENHRKWLWGEEGGSRADLSGADLSGADLSGAVLSDAVLSRAVLSRAVLSDAGMSGVPSIPNIHQRVYEAANKPGCLDMSQWHSCETTHCRAGWVVALAGEGGAALEWAMGTPAAAAIIYMKSDPKLERVPNFYTDNETALEDMKRLAEEEAARAI